MLRAEENEILTRVGQGTLMGELLRRYWTPACLTAEIPEPGDYFINYIGEDQVICVRDEEGRVNVLLNTCRHRGNALCRAERGRAKSFVCSYHGWNYALDGSLIGAPGQRTYFRGDLDRSQLGLVRARVESYLGFYFATMAPLVVRDHVIVGVSGDVTDVRGFLVSLDPETGTVQWRWYTEPDPGQPGSETWPQDGDALLHGGGMTWMTGTYDPALNLLYWGTGNPNPVLVAPSSL